MILHNVNESCHEETCLNHCALEFFFFFFLNPNIIVNPPQKTDAMGIHQKHPAKYLYTAPNKEFFDQKVFIFFLTHCRLNRLSYIGRVQFQF